MVFILKTSRSRQHKHIRVPELGVRDSSRCDNEEDTYTEGDKNHEKRVREIVKH